MSDRRTKDSRRAQDRRKHLDRREKNDRRTKEGRRTAELAGKGKATATAKSSRQGDSAKGGSGFKTFIASFVKKLALILFITVIVITLLLVYFFSNIDYYMGKAAKRVSIAIERANLDPESLTNRSTRARVYFDVGNDLPFDIILQDLKFKVNLSDYTVAKGVQIIPRKKIKSGEKQNVAVQFHVDSIMARRGLQKAVSKNAGPILKSFLARLKGKNQTITDNLKGIMKIKGTAGFRMLVGSMEIPFTRILDFSPGS
ncbi:MAG: hypothetical protein ACQETH_07205 [Candidatus Rifleibacteriota bacterium]